VVLGSDRGDMVMVLGKCAGLVVYEAMATPASLKIFTLKSVCFGEVIGVDGLWFWGVYVVVLGRL
jgi:hypothetical protein